jgi:hypothetical protein
MTVSESASPLMSINRSSGSSKIGVGVRELAHQADFDQVAMEFLLGERLRLPGRFGSLGAPIGHRSIVGHGLPEPGQSITDHIIPKAVIRDQAPRTA